MSEPVAIVINTDVLPDVDGMYRHDVLSDSRLPNQAELFIHPDSRVAELEAVLVEAREALVMNIVGTGGRTPAAHEAIAKIDEVLKK